MFWYNNIFINVAWPQHDLRAFWLMWSNKTPALFGNMRWLRYVTESHDQVHIAMSDKMHISKWPVRHSCSVSFLALHASNPSGRGRYSPIARTGRTAWNKEALFFIQLVLSSFYVHINKRLPATKYITVFSVTITTTSLTNLSSIRFTKYLQPAIRNMTESENLMQ